MADNGRWSSWMLDSEKLASSHTLPEHYSVVALLQRLDHAWFHDNLLKPRVGLIDAFLPFSQPPSPYQSIELMDAAHSKWAASPLPQRPRSREMPRACFEALSRTRALGGTPFPGNDLSEGSMNALEPDHGSHHPSQSVRTLVSKRHVLSNPLADTVLLPPATLQAWVVKDLPNLKVHQPAMRVLGTRRMQRKNSKSMTALEFDELQGFRDLGFHFSQDDLTPRIVSMFPGLRHKLEENSKQGITIVTKPKQSSAAAWLVRRSAAPSHHWQVPATSEDMKEHLKFWARAVASTVRQEC